MIDVPQPEGRPSPGQMLRLVWLALRLAWQSGPRELATILALVVVQAAGLAAIVLLSQRLVQDVLAGTDVVASAALVAGVGAVLAFCRSLSNEQQRMLNERCERHTRSRIHDV